MLRNGTGTLVIFDVVEMDKNVELMLSIPQVCLCLNESLTCCFVREDGENLHSCLL